MENNKFVSVPKDGLQGLKENFGPDMLSGFTVFLLALPLSLGIAKASDFPPLMGLVSAIIGGIVVGLFMGAKLTIKGPAAGLIVIVASAVAEFGGGETGWHLALGAIVVAGIIQILFGVLKLGKLVDFFPLSAIHGMLAAIGLIIIAKQVPVLLGVDPSMAKGKGPLQLLGSIPSFLANLNPNVTIIGVVSLAIMQLWPKLKIKALKIVPAPLVVLLVAIPMQLFFDFSHTQKPFTLVKIGNLLDNIKVNVSFEGLGQTGIFIKYVVMFALVGTLESLLTVKAIDLLDPYKRKSDTNKDLIALGLGNTLAGILGGLPMISEVARSSSNVSNGAKTRWANVFHGIFILVFVLLAAHLIEMIPNAALAAMLITVGLRLAHHKEFIHAFEIGKEQLAIMLVTVFFTMYEDLLVGIGAGILLKIIIHLINGAPLKALFKAGITVSEKGNIYEVDIKWAAIFTNYLGIKSKLDSIPQGKHIIVKLVKTYLVDHSVMGSLELFQNDYVANGGRMEITGLEEHKSLSDHPLSTKKKIGVMVL